MTGFPNSIFECKESIRLLSWEENQPELLAAANTLMQNCQEDASITLEDGLRCLDHGGVVAEMGARILYLLTGRDGLGWEHAGYKDLPYHVDKQNWLDYLKQEYQPENGS